MKIRFAALGMTLLLAAPVLALAQAATNAAPATDMTSQTAAPAAADTMAPSKKAKAAAPAQDEAGVKAAFANVSDAWNAGDAKKVASNFTPDSSFMNAKGDEGHGKKEIQKMFAAEFEGPMKGSQIAFDDFQIRFWNNSALVDCTATMTGLKKEDGTDADPMKTHVFSILVNRSGKKWESLVVRVYGMHQPAAAADTPAAAAPAAASTTPTDTKPAAKDSNP